MLEAGTLQIETVEIPQVQSTGQDPMTPRWAINCAVRGKLVEVSKAGFGELYFGKWQKLPHFTIPEEVHSTDDDPGLPRERPVTKTALSVERYLDSMLGGKTINGHDDPQKSDWGIRFAFYGEEDLAKMEVISATLLPSLPTIRQIAENYNMPSPIGARCDGEDPADFGERQSCPTCWSIWIESECCNRFMNEIATNGRGVEVKNILTEQLTRDHIKPTTAELETSRRLMTESLQRGLAANQKTWSDVAKELEEGARSGQGRRGTDAYQNEIRKDVHAPKPQDAELNKIREFARASSINQSAPMTGNDFTDEEMAKIYTDRVAAKQAEILPAGLDGTFIIGAPVLCDGLPGVIKETKTGGWIDVALDNGEVKTVRKDRIQGRMD